MKISINTDSVKTLRAIRSEIIRMNQNTEDAKYIFFVSREDFIEHLYRLAQHTTTSTVHIDYNAPSVDTGSDAQHISITTGVILLTKRYMFTFEIASAGFTYP